jgi:hypothetical protein
MHPDKYHYLYRIRHEIPRTQDRPEYNETHKPCVCADDASLLAELGV